jgi:uncharacterized RDD family membrane protein YckC
MEPTMTTATTADPPVPADLTPRLIARGIDVAVVTAITVGLGRAVGFGFDWLAIATVIIVGYFVVLDAAAGATPGKLALGLRVVGPDGERPTLRQALRREAFMALGSIPFIGVPVAVFVWVRISREIARDPLRQGGHDRFAGGTRVIQVR